MPVMLEKYISSEATIQEELLSGNEGVKKAVRDRTRKIQEKVTEAERVLAEGR